MGMEKFEAKNPTSQLFICCKEKEGKPCCASKGSVAMVDELKAWLKEKNLNKQLRVSQSSCLGHCENGITACLYPQNTWFKEVTPGDIESFKELLVSLTPQK